MDNEKGVCKSNIEHNRVVNGQNMVSLGIRKGENEIREEIEFEIIIEGVRVV